MNYSYRLSREECDAIIAALARCYPACFFENPKLRRPLKNDILDDPYAEEAPFTREEKAAAVDWYKSHFAYQYALQAGAKRVDLIGREAGTVTMAEQRSAEFYIAKRKQEMQAREALPAFVQTPVRVVGDDASRRATVHHMAPTPPPLPPPQPPQPPQPPPLLEVSLSSARSADADQVEGKGSKKKTGQVLDAMSDVRSYRTRDPLCPSGRRHRDQDSTVQG